MRFDANLGILEHEKSIRSHPGRCRRTEPGRAPLAPRDDDIGHVLDYRRVRQIIIDECTAEHVNLLRA